jgi:hypothetical protein
VTRPLIQIVPLWSTAPEGVGDYARLLAGQLLHDHNRRSIFVSGTPLPAAKRRCDDWESRELAERSAAALHAAVTAVGASAPILLHLSSYGYQNRGVPFWLVAALDRWRRDNANVPLVTIFHELFATGPIWRSSFWLGPLQAHIVRRIRRISTGGIATTEPYARRLETWPTERSGAIVALPVFSTIGEIEVVVPASVRRRTLAVFARPHAARRLYRERRAEIARFVTDHAFHEILDIGERPEPLPDRIGTAAVRSVGALPADQVRALLGEALFGWLDYDADRLAKSTVFAAYCASGVIPVCYSDQPGDNDGLRPGATYLRLPADRCAPFSAQALDTLQDNARRWYGGHSLPSSTSIIDALLAAAPAKTGDR